MEQISNEADIRIGRILRLGIGFLILLYGLWIFDVESRIWGTISLVLYALPLAAQALRAPMPRAWALWFGVLLVAQSLLSPLLKGDYVSLPPNLNSSLDMRTPDKAGMPPGLRRITTDSKGYRAQPPVDYARKQGLRIIAIGGSTTEDIVLDDRATWTHLLQESLKRRGHPAEVINTGVSGLRARNHIATLKAIAGYAPDLVTILVGGNDWNKHIRDQFEPDRDPYKPATLRDSALGKLLARYVMTPLRVRLLGATSTDQHIVVTHPEAVNAGKPIRSLDRPTKHNLRPTDVSAGYRTDMETLSKTCTQLALRCLFMTQPHAYSDSASRTLRDLYWMTPPYADYTLDLGSMMHIAALYNGFLLDLARREGHASCDLAAGMPARDDLFFDDMHYTDAGAQRMAELALPCVEAILKK